MVVSFHIKGWSEVGLGKTRAGALMKAFVQKMVLLIWGTHQRANNTSEYVVFILVVTLNTAPLTLENDY